MKKIFALFVGAALLGFLACNGSNNNPNADHAADKIAKGMHGGCCCCCGGSGGGSNSASSYGGFGQPSTVIIPPSAPATPITVHIDAALSGSGVSIAQDIYFNSNNPAARAKVLQTSGTGGVSYDIIPGTKYTIMPDAGVRDFTVTVTRDGATPFTVFTPFPYPNPSDWDVYYQAMGDKAIVSIH